LKIKKYTRQPHFYTRLRYCRLDKPVCAKHEKNIANLTSLQPKQKETTQQLFPNFLSWHTICGSRAASVFHLGVSGVQIWKFCNWVGSKIFS